MMNRKQQIKILSSIGFVTILLLSLLAFASIAHRGITTILILAGQPLPTNSNAFEIRYERSPWLTLTHVVGGTLFLLTGPIQFVTSIRNRYRTFHRVCGMIYLLASLISVVSALLFVRYLPVFGTFTASVATVYASILFIIATGMAYWQIKRRNIPAHREWMIRSFALGLAIATLRLLLPVLIIFCRVKFDEAWDVAIWLAFSLHLLVAETWIQFTRPKSRASVD